MDFLRRLIPNRLQSEDGNPGGALTRNFDSTLVTPENDPHIVLQQQAQLRQAPRVLPINRRRHFSDGLLPLLGQQQQANQNGGQRQEGGGPLVHRRTRQEQVARVVIGNASGYPNTRAQHRRYLASLPSADQLLSSANPASFADFYFNDTVRPVKFSIILQMPPRSKEEQENHAWNPEDRSTNIFVKEDDPLTLHRLPIAQSTDGIRGKIGYSRGFHVWQITWPTTQRGTHALVGVATKQAALQKMGYTTLLGSDTESYGWDINKNRCMHDGTIVKGWTYPNTSATGVNRTFKVSDKFYCILDMDEGYLAFATENNYLGVAFRGLKGKTLYPVIGAVWGHCEISLRYIGGINPLPRQLMDTCRRNIRIQMAGQGFAKLGLPKRLEQYLLYA